LEERKDATIQKLQELSQKIFVKEQLILSVTSEREGLEKFSQEFSRFAGEKSFLKQAAPTIGARNFEKKCLNEGFMTSSQVQYVAMGSLFPDQNYELPGALLVLKVLMSYEYLWLNLRVKGGAYGCMNTYTEAGEMGFVSYRDPNLKNTVEIYQAIPDYIRQLAIDGRELQKYIIGAIGESDTPLQPHAKGIRSMAFYLSGKTLDSVNKRRGQVLNCTLQDLQNLAPVIEKALSGGALCVVGSEEKIQADQNLFLKLTTLTGEEA